MSPSANTQFARPGKAFELPPSSTLPDIVPSGPVDDSWCGTHIDHSLLTVLCPSMYLFHPAVEEGSNASLDPLVIPSPSRDTGLFIKTRAGDIVRAVIP